MLLYVPLDTYVNGNSKANNILVCQTVTSLVKFNNFKNKIMLNFYHSQSARNTKENMCIS